jgi:hypothetical protein
MIFKDSLLPSLYYIIIIEYSIELHFNEIILCYIRWYLIKIKWYYILQLYYKHYFTLNYIIYELIICYITFLLILYNIILNYTKSYSIVVYYIILLYCKLYYNILHYIILYYNYIIFIL